MVRRQSVNLLQLSQNAGQIFLEGLGFSRMRFEIEGRVDVEATSPTEEIYRLELKLISLINEAKGRVVRAIRETKRRMDKKGLTHLLFLTPLRLRETDDKHFIKVKGYCLLGIFVSKSELKKKKEEDLVAEVGEEVESHLVEEVELISIGKAEFLENLKLEEQRMELEEQRIELERQTQEMLDRLGTKTDEFEQKLNEISSKTEYHGEMIEDQGKMIEDQGKMIEDQGKMIEDQGKMIKKIDDKLTETQQQLDRLMKLLSEKLG